MLILIYNDDAAHFEPDALVRMPLLNLISLLELGSQVHSRASHSTSVTGGPVPRLS